MVCMCLLFTAQQRFVVVVAIVVWWWVSAQRPVAVGNSNNNVTPQILAFFLFLVSVSVTCGKQQ